MIMFLNSLLKQNPGRPRNIRAIKVFVLFHQIHQMMKHDKYKKLLKKQRSVQTYLTNYKYTLICFLSASS